MALNQYFRLLRIGCLTSSWQPYCAGTPLFFVPQPFNSLEWFPNIYCNFLFDLPVIFIGTKITCLIIISVKFKTLKSEKCSENNLSQFMQIDLHLYYVLKHCYMFWMSWRRFGRIERNSFEICNNDLKCGSNEMLFELGKPARMLTDL